MSFIEQLRELAGRATPGPWAFETDRSYFDSAAVVSADGFVWANYYRRDDDARLVVLLLNSIPEILAMAEENERLREAILAVVSATRAYLPPDGIDAHDCLNRIIAATDNQKINPIIEDIENERN